MSIESVMPSDHLILYCPLLLLSSIFPSIRVFSNESVLCIRWPKYWSFSFSISPSNEYSGIIIWKLTPRYPVRLNISLTCILAIIFLLGMYEVNIKLNCWWKDGWMDRWWWRERWADEWMMNRWMNGQMDGWMGG